MSEISSEPIEEGMRYFTDLCTLIGFVVTHWSLAENQIDNWASVCFNDLGGAKFQKGAGVPRMLSSKVAFLKQCFKALPILADFRIDGLALLDRFSSAAKRRNDLMHGSLMELRPDPVTGAFKFRRIGYKGDLYLISEFTLTPNDFREFAPTLSDLVTDAISFSRKLADRFPGS